MAFLQLWWDKQATDLQKRQFTQLVAEKRIEFTDNGWECYSSLISLRCFSVDGGYLVQVEST